eukprot:scaffold4902_cov115-Cylindrotheca_fusiformis.AAC.7
MDNKKIGRRYLFERLFTTMRWAIQPVVPTSKRTSCCAMSGHVSMRDNTIKIVQRTRRLPYT